MPIELMLFRFGTSNRLSELVFLGFIYFCMLGLWYVSFLRVITKCLH